MKLGYCLRSYWVRLLVGKLISCLEIYSIEKKGLLLDV
jgi:hypothetical protein